MFVIAKGNAFDGLELIGTFGDAGDAITWAQDNCGDESWEVVLLVSPSYLSPL